MRYIGASQVMVVLQVDGGAPDMHAGECCPRSSLLPRLGSSMSRYAVRTSWLSCHVAHILLS